MGGVLWVSRWGGQTLCLVGAGAPLTPADPGVTPGRHTQLPSPAQAFSNFYYTFHFLNVTSKQPLATVNATVWEFCQRPWKQVDGTWDHPSPPALPSTLGCRCPRHRPPQAGPRQDRTPRGVASRAGGCPGKGRPRQGTQGPILGWDLPLVGRERGCHLAPRLPGPQVEASSPGQDHWLRDYCASGLYILTLLLEGYGFREDTWSSIEFRKQVTTSRGEAIRHKARGAVGDSGAAATALTGLPVPQLGGMDIGWTLGYTLNLTSMIPAQLPARWRAESYGVWAAGVVFAVLTVVATLGATAVHLLWPRG